MCKQNLRCAQVLQSYAAIRPHGLRTLHNMASHVVDKIAKKKNDRRVCSFSMAQKMLVIFAKIGFSSGSDPTF